MIKEIIGDQGPYGNYIHNKNSNYTTALGKPWAIGYTKIKNSDGSPHSLEYNDGSKYWYHKQFFGYSKDKEIKLVSINRISINFYFYSQEKKLFIWNKVENNKSVFKNSLKFLKQQKFVPDRLILEVKTEEFSEAWSLELSGNWINEFKELIKVVIK